MGLPADDPEPDRVLIERFQQGEREAFDRIVTKYRRDLYRISYRMTGTHEGADDITQEAFLRAYRALGRFRGDSALRTWLIRIALNLAISASRSRAALPMDEGALEAAAARGGGAGPLAESRVLGDERAREVRRAVHGLPPRQKQVVILRMYEELPFKEIAALLECPIGTVKANFFHAMGNLRKALS